MIEVEAVDLIRRWDVVATAIAQERIVAELELLVGMDSEADPAFDISFGDGNSTKRGSTKLDS